MADAGRSPPCHPHTQGKSPGSRIRARAPPPPPRARAAAPRRRRRSDRRTLAPSAATTSGGREPALGIGLTASPAAEYHGQGERKGQEGVEVVELDREVEEVGD